MKWALRYASAGRQAARSEMLYSRLMARHPERLLQVYAQVVDGVVARPDPALVAAVMEAAGGALALGRAWSALPVCPGVVEDGEASPRDATGAGPCQLLLRMAGPRKAVGGH